MRLRRPHVRPPPETIIALVDVAFFLLAFFMLIGRLDATAPFEVMPPIGASGTDLPAGGVTVSVAADGALAVEGVPVDTAVDMVAEALVGDPELQVRINAHRDAELRHVLPLVSEIEALGAREVVLVVTPGAP